MQRFWRALFRRNRKPAAEDYPRSMQDLRGGDACWCGSGEPYRKCHRPADRKRQKELGLDRRKGSICDAFT